MKKLLMMIPSYKRPEVLDFTLKNLCDNTERGVFDVEIVVGLNKVTEQDRNILANRKKESESAGFSIISMEFEKNIGKAECLNTIVDKYYKGQDYVISMDNDMWIKSPWLQMLNLLSAIDYELVAFGGIRFWSHVPPIDSNYEPLGPYQLYVRPYLAGGMLLYSRGFIETFKFLSRGCMYGGEDGHSCTQAKKKFVMYWESDWIEHDPLRGSTEALKNYENRKGFLLSKNVIFFPEGWDE